MADKFYSWDDYIRLNEKLVATVAKSGWEFDNILCLSRGGMRPGDFFSRVYDMRWLSCRRAPTVKQRALCRAPWISLNA